jgi:hypothetical protein
MWTAMKSLLAGLLVLTAAGVLRADDEAEARALIAKSIEAAGGAANLAKHNAATWKEKGTYYGMGEGLPYAGDYAVQWPGQFKMEIQGVFAIVLDGDKGWMKTGGQTLEMTGENLAVHLSNHRAGWIATLLPLKDKDFALKLLGESKVDERPVVGVKVTRKEYPDVELYFDKTTHLLSKISYPTKVPEEQFKGVTAEISFANFIEIEGAKVPSKVSMKRDGKRFVEAEMEEIHAVGKLDDVVFGKP